MCAGGRGRAGGGIGGGGTAGEGRGCGGCGGRTWWKRLWAWWWWWWLGLEEEGGGGTGGGEDIADSWRASYDSGTAAAGPCLIIDPTISGIS